MSMAAALQAAPLVAALLCLIGLSALAFTAATSRALFAMTMSLAAFGALAALAALALGAPQAALALALFGVAIAPVTLLGVLLLSSRAAKARRRGRAWATPAAAILFAGAVLATGNDSTYAPRVADVAGVGALWIALALIAAGLGAFALLAFGERGAMGVRDQ